MAEIVNLRLARKQKARTQKTRDAERNRAAFGRTREERQGERRLTELAERHLDGHRLGATDKEK